MGQEVRRADITAITNADPCVVTTLADHEFPTGAFVRLTDLNGMMPVPRGEDPLNNYRFKIIVTASNQFSLHDPITGEAINSTDFPPYIEGGYVTMIQTDFNYT